MKSPVNEIPPGWEPGQVNRVDHCFPPSNSSFCRVCVCVCVCVCMCENMPLTTVHIWDSTFHQAKSLPCIYSGDIWEWKEVSWEDQPSGWLDLDRSVLPKWPPRAHGWPGEVAHSEVTTVHGQPQTSSSSTPHPAPQPCLLPVNGGPCLSLIVATHLATLSMICLPSCFFSNTQTHLEAVLLRQRVVVMAPKIKNHTTAKLVLRKQNILWLALDRGCASPSPWWLPPGPLSRKHGYQWLRETHVQSWLLGMLYVFSFVNNI